VKVSLDHAQIFKVPLVLGQLDQILKKVDNVRADIDVILVLHRSDGNETTLIACLFKLLENARVEVLGELAMLQRKPNHVIGVVLARIEALQAVGEDEAKLEWI
jgi:hypothetical protein